MARIVSACSPFTAPDSTVEPGVFDITNGSPVRYDSSIAPRPSTTTPSTGQISCGYTTTRSSTAIASSAMSSTAVPLPRRRCAAEGMRRDSAASTEDALRTAYCSSAVPPESISTTSAPARYSPSSTAVTIEMPARRSEPNSRRSALRASTQTSGPPPRTSAARSGARARAGVAWKPKRSSRWAPIAAVVSSAIHVSARGRPAPALPVMPTE